MVRIVNAVIAGYLLSGAITLILFAGLLFGLGPNWLLIPGTYNGGVFLTIAAPSITLAAGVLGGWLCRRIGRVPSAVVALAVVVLVAGQISAYFTLQKPEPTGPRDPNLSTAQFLEKGREPTWLVLLNPPLGAAAALVGGLLLSGRKRHA